MMTKKNSYNSPHPHALLPQESVLAVLLIKVQTTKCMRPMYSTVASPLTTTNPPP